MRKTHILVGFLAATGLLVGTFVAVHAALPDIPFYDGFGTGNTASNVPGWDESSGYTVALQPSSGNDSASPDGGRFAKIGDGEWICVQLDATGFYNLSLSYYWRGDTDAENNDYGKVYVRKGSSCTANSGWEEVASHSLNSTDWSSLHSVTLPSPEADNTNFALRFKNDAACSFTNSDHKCDGDWSDDDPSAEYFRIDGVSVTGGQPENTLERCIDDIDNDADQAIDFDDSDCAQFMPNLTVNKVVVNDDGGIAEVSDFPLYIDQTAVTSGEANNLVPGTYVVHEDGDEGYASSYGGDCDEEGGVTLAANEHKTCTITNDDIAAKLTVTKIVEGGDKQVSDFALYANDTQVTSGVQNEFSAGQYTVHENGFENYIPSYSGDCEETDGGASIVLGNGGIYTCEITNTYDACLNLEGVQEEIPQGYEMAEGACVPVQEPGEPYPTYLSEDTGCPEGTEPVLVGTYDIDSQDADGVSFETLAGNYYVFEASGTFVPTSAANWFADAGFSTDNNWDSIKSDYGIYGTPPDKGAHALLADLGSGVGILDWGAFSGTHVYTKAFQVLTSAVQFLIGDRYGDWYQTDWQNQAGMNDNSGSLQLDVYQCIEPESELTIIATKVVCDDESMLPNWGNGGPNITADTATDWVNQHEACRLEPGWNFQWGKNSVSNPGDNSGEAGNGWHTFGPTGQNGQTQITITEEELNDTSRIKMREVWQDGFISFTGANTTQDVSAEMYCYEDVLNYDNYDYINNPQMDTTYYCVAFNVPVEEEPVEPQPVYGCTDEAALNYNAEADTDNGTCDYCSNLEDETGIPEGWTRDEQGVCTEPQEESTDVCPNIEGVQETIPEGMELDDQNNCVEPEDEGGDEGGGGNGGGSGDNPPPTDVCHNIQGVQETVPEGYRLVNDNCVPNNSGGNGPPGIFGGFFGSQPGPYLGGGLVLGESTSLEEQIALLKAKIAELQGQALGIMQRLLLALLNQFLIALQAQLAALAS